MDEIVPMQLPEKRLERAIKVKGWKGDPDFYYRIELMKYLAQFKPGVQGNYRL